jgi:hypothetical protein
LSWHHARIRSRRCRRPSNRRSPVYSLSMMK